MRQNKKEKFKKYMDQVSEKDIETNKSFWNFIKPFMRNKGMVASSDITLIEGKNVITVSMRFHGRLTKTILILSKKAAETNLTK